MKKTIFYNKVTVDSTEELDFLWNSLSEFEMKYEPGYYRVDDSDIPDPALISYKVYGDVGFWWIILLANGIENPLIELEPGMILKIPNKLDIYDFQRKWRVRRA
jgi:hypothetical protein